MKNLEPYEDEVYELVKTYDEYLEGGGTSLYEAKLMYEDAKLALQE